MVDRLVSLLLATVLLTGCSSLLPRGSSDTHSPFDSCAQAQGAAERIVPFQTQVHELASRVESQRNPLGPFQPAGEDAASLLIR